MSRIYPFQLRTYVDDVLICTQQFLTVQGLEKAYKKELAIGNPTLDIRIYYQLGGVYVRFEEEDNWNKLHISLFLNK